MKRLTDSEYKQRLANIGIKCIGVYTRCTDVIEHVCPKCNKVWMVRPTDIIHGGHRCCRVCNENMKESLLANVLKQVCMHEDASTIIEADIGFRGKGKGISTYDILIESRKLVIECQSRYHDSKEEFDNEKKNFAIHKGYKYIAIDNRNYSEIEAIQLIFPYIKEIPEYIKDKYIGYNKKVNYEEITRLLHKGYTYNEVAKITGTTYSIIQNAVTSGRVRGSRDKSVVATYSDMTTRVLKTSQLPSGRTRCCIYNACRGKQAGKDGHYYKGVRYEFKEE